MQENTTVEALLFERSGYVMRDLPDRVAQVDAQIKAISGLVVDDDIETAEAEPVADIETTDAAPVKHRAPAPKQAKNRRSR